MLSKSCYSRVSTTEMFIVDAEVSIVGDEVGYLPLKFLFAT